MVVTIWRDNFMDDVFLDKLRKDFPGLTFTEGTRLHWSPKKSNIVYSRDNGVKGIWGVLHELGHALLNHRSYKTDAELIRKETEAWQEAYVLGKRYGIQIDEGYMQDCLDTYRDWIHKRSQCPTCNLQSLQQNEHIYYCANCKSTWQVTSSRLCRPYRHKVQK